VKDKRRIIYYLASSADGFIARANGSVDWLENRPATDYGFANFLRSVDTVVWGRRTFDESRRRGGIEPFGPNKRHVVLSHFRRPAWAPAGVEFTSSPVEALARRLRRGKGKGIWLMGGAKLAAAFLDAGQVDEVIVHVIPLLLGSGIPWFEPAGAPSNCASTRRAHSRTASSASITKS